MDEPLAIVFLIKPWYCQDVFIQWLKTKCINDATTIYCGAYFDVCLVYGNLVQWDRIVHWLHLHHKKDLLMCTWTTAAASSELSDVRCFSRIPLLHWEYLHHLGSLLITQTTLSHRVCCWEMKTLMLQFNIEIILCHYIEEVEVCLYVPGKYMIVASLFSETFRCQFSDTLCLTDLIESIKMLYHDHQQTHACGVELHNW